MSSSGHLLQAGPHRRTHNYIGRGSDRVCSVLSDKLHFSLLVKLAFSELKIIIQIVGGLICEWFVLLVLAGWVPRRGADCCVTHWTMV